MRRQIPRAVGAAVDLGENAVLDLRLDPALRVALLADRIENLLRLGKSVVRIRRQIITLPVSESLQEARDLSGHRRAAAEQRRALQKVSAGTGKFSIARHARIRLRSLLFLHAPPPSRNGSKRTLEASPGGARLPSTKGSFSIAIKNTRAAAATTPMATSHSVRLGK